MYKSTAVIVGLGARAAVLAWLFHHLLTSVWFAASGFHANVLASVCREMDKN